MIQNSLFVLGFKEKKTGKFIPVGEADVGPYVPEDGYVEHKDGSCSVRVQFPEVELD